MLYICVNRIASVQFESLKFFSETDLVEKAEGLDGSFAKKLLTLSKKFPRKVAADALELIELRKTDKFSRAGKMWFDREGLEMATHETVARYRAERFFGRIADLCCGIGGDAIVLASRGRLAAFDIDPVRVEMARHNLSVYGVAGEVKAEDVTKLDLNSLDADWFFFDPQRRGRESPNTEAMLNRIRETGAKYAVKLAPDFKGDVERISLNHELREACLWSTGGRKVTVLPSEESLGVSGKEPPEITGIREYLLEPDPGIIVSGAFGELAGKYPCTRIDARIAYLTSDKKYKTEFFSSQLKVLEVVSGDIARVSEALRKHGIGPVEIKCRGFQVSPERLRKQLGGKGKPGVAVFTRARGKRVAIIARRETF